MFFSALRREVIFDLYEPDQVHLLPGYPRNVSGSLQVAFYVQQPAGLFTGNTSVLPSKTLLQIVKLNESDLEKAIGANITSFKATFVPTTPLPTTKVQEYTISNRDSLIFVAIGVSVAGVSLLFLVFTAIYVWR